MQKTFQAIWGNDIGGALHFQGIYQDGQWKEGTLKGNQNDIPVFGGIPFFGSEAAGDQFDRQDIELWTNGGLFQKNWTRDLRFGDGQTKAYSMLCKKAAELDLPVLDIACGPGLGLIPEISKMNSSLPCLATDACPLVVREWQKFLAQQGISHNISFASFDASDIPILNGSVDVITSNIGLSSVRSIGHAREKSVTEVFRVLKKGGSLFTVENQWTDMTAVREVFRLWGRKCWREEEAPWEQKFNEAGFKVIDSQLLQTYKLKSDDNELGQAANEFGVDIITEYRVYELRKP